jgi:hypothetical protein
MTPEHKHTDGICQACRPENKGENIIGVDFAYKTLPTKMDTNLELIRQKCIEASEKDILAIVIGDSAVYPH